MVRENVLVTVAFAESVTRMVTGKVPETRGVPINVSDPLKVSPGGSAPMTENV
jgi:hypothetical protein